MATEIMAMVTVPEIQQVLIRALDRAQVDNGVMRTKIHLPDFPEEVLISHDLEQGWFDITLPEGCMYRLLGAYLFKSDKGASWKVNGFDPDDLFEFVARFK